jgi:hypothetical protein
MKRREFLIFLCGAAALRPLPPRAQHAKLPGGDPVENGVVVLWTGCFAGFFALTGCD